MISPDTLKSLGFWILVAGLCGEILVLFVPAGRRTLEKTLSIVFIIVVISGVTMEKIGDSILSAINEPRHLTPKQSKRFTASLLKDPGHSVTIVSAMLDHEANDFADGFVSLLSDGKWDISPRIRNWIRPEYGVTIGRGDEGALPGEKALDSALTAADIKHNIKQITGDNARAMSPWLAPGTLYLLIGPRPLH